MLNPNDPAVDPTTAYDWGSLDVAIDEIKKAKKTLQIAVSPGESSPGWLFGPTYMSSCDYLFLTPDAGPLLPAHDCGYTTIFSSSSPQAFTSTTPQPFPLPWNPNYKSQWKAFLIALREHIKEKKAEKYVVSIPVEGPTWLSGEMILPNNTFPGLHGDLTVPNPPPGYATSSGVTTGSAWNCLFNNNYYFAPSAPSASAYVNSNRAFIEEWAAAIDMYGEVFDETFGGVTLTVSTGNGLPDFTGSTLVNTVPGCGLYGIGIPGISL
jgi:hypothetical protein